MEDGQVSHVMSDEEELQSASDEDFLDRAFERAVSLFEEGASLGPGDLLDGREHLRAHVESLLRTAREVTLVRSDALPRVRGFTLLSEIGRGGMGAVYLARQDALGGRKVALKVLPGSAGLSHSARQRFLAEARAIANLRHANVVTVHDVIAEEAVCAYAMEWIDGASLAQLIDSLRFRAERDSVEPMAAHAREALGAESSGADEPYPIFVCRIAIAIARALAALHRAGLVHRDVKPSNILLRRDGTPLLSDFGLVHVVDGKLTQAGQFVGTVAYASPEQLGGDPESLDARSDVYSLGVTLYHALTLHLPFDERRARRASTPTGMLRLIESGRAMPLRSWNRRLPRDLETIVAKAMDVERAGRYASADELADDLERLLALQPIRARRAGLLSRTAKLVRRNRAAALGLTAGSVVSLALAAAAVVYLFFVPRWVEDHVREARLELLDPGYANRFFNAELFGVEVRGEPPLLSPVGLAQALESYDTALRWSLFDDAIREERDVVADAAGRANSGAAQSNERSSGLRAYLRGDVDAALESWAAWERRRDPRAAADPLIEAMIGLLHLVRDEPARAYPRLREACRVFPNVGFLTTYLADAAVRCGDFESAESLLAVARDMPRLDPFGALERVTADLYAATGRDERAEELFRRGAPSRVLDLHHARFLGRRGRVEESIDRYVEISTALRGPAVKRECAAALERWWASQSSAERLQHVSAALDLDPVAPRSLVARLRLYRTTQPLIHSREHSGDSATLRVGSSSPPLQSVGLADLAAILEVENMTRWSRIPTYPSFLKKLQLWAWHSPGRRELSHLIYVALACVTTQLSATKIAAGQSMPGFTVEHYATVSDPITMAFGSAGELYVGNNCPGACGVWLVAPGGKPVSEYGASIEDPDTVAFDLSGAVSGVPGSVIVGGWHPAGARISAIHPDQSVHVLFSNGGSENPGTLKLDGAGELVFTDTNIASADTGGRLMLTASGSLETVFTSVPAPYGLAIASDGRLYTCDGNGVVRIHAPDGTVLNPSFVTGLRPYAPLVLGPGDCVWGDYLYSLGSSGSDMVRIDGLGTVTVLGSGFAAYTQDMVFGPDEALYLSINSPDEILRVAPVVTYCTATPNSTGAPADLTFSGSTSSAAGDLMLRAEPVPNQSGIFFHAMNQAELAFGNGFLCATGDVRRGAVIFTSGNVGTYVYDNSDSKHSLVSYVGSRRNFQFWFRDPMGGGALFNLSNAISLTVCP